MLKTANDNQYQVCIKLLRLFYPALAVAIFLLCAGFDGNLSSGFFASCDIPEANAQLVTFFLLLASLLICDGVAHIPGASHGIGNY